MGQHHPEIIIQTPIYYVKSHKMFSNLPKNNLGIEEQSISSTKLGNSPQEERRNDPKEDDSTSFSLNCRTG
jgi:hypothetical protein